MHTKKIAAITKSAPIPPAGLTGILAREWGFPGKRARAKAVKLSKGEKIVLVIMMTRKEDDKEGVEP